MQLFLLLLTGTVKSRQLTATEFSLLPDAQFQFIIPAVPTS